MRAVRRHTRAAPLPTATPRAPACRRHGRPVEGPHPTPGPHAAGAGHRVVCVRPGAPGSPPGPPAWPARLAAWQPVCRPARRRPWQLPIARLSHPGRKCVGRRPDRPCGRPGQLVQLQAACTLQGAAAHSRSPKPVARVPVLSLARRSLDILSASVARRWRREGPAPRPAQCWALAPPPDALPVASRASTGLAHALLGKLEPCRSALSRRPAPPPSPRGPRFSACSLPRCPATSRRPPVWPQSPPVGAASAACSHARQRLRVAQFMCHAPVAHKIHTMLRHLQLNAPACTAPPSCRRWRHAVAAPHSLQPSSPLNFAHCVTTSCPFFASAFHNEPITMRGTSSMPPAECRPCK